MDKAIIAIDGFASTGKSTLGKMLSKFIGLPYIDSGALFRGITFLALEKGWIVNNIIDEISIEEDINIPEEIFVNGAELTTLWSTAINLASELGVDKYQVMYALYEGNKDSFINNDINSPRADRNYFVDMSIIENVDISFASDEVKRHIYCRC